MTTKKTPKKPSLELTAKDLARLTAPVVPHASGDVTFPLLQSVLIRQAGQYVTAIATDRYKIGFQRIAAADGVQIDSGFRAVVPVAALKRIRAIFRATKAHNPVLRLTVDGDQLLVEVADGFDAAFGAIAGASLRFALTTGEYPKIDRLVREAINAEPADEAVPMNVNPNFLADFRTGQPMHTPMTVTSTGHVTKPWLIRVGEDFLGLLVPVRAASDTAWPGNTEWLDLLDPAEKPAAAKKEAA